MKKSMIVILVAILLGAITFFSSQYFYKQKQLQRQEEQQQRIIETEISKVQDKFFSDIGQFYEEGPKNGVIIATVNGWPITEDELFYREKMRQSYGSESDTNFIFNMLLEEKVCLSQAQAYGVLPTESEINAEIAAHKQEMLKDIEFGNSIKALIADWGINEDIYWNIWETYNTYREQAFNNLSNQIKEDWWSSVNPKNSENEYYYIKILEFKQNAKVNVLKDNAQYTPILDRLFLPSHAPKDGLTLEAVNK